MINDSGERREFATGAVRDIQEGKGRCDLLPMYDVLHVLATGDWIHAPAEHPDEVLKWIGFGIQDARDGKSECARKKVAIAAIKFIQFRGWNPYEAMIELSKHFEEGALKYGERNWEKGIPWHCYFDSGIRHFLKFKAAYTDERHDRAFLWNMICLMWTINNHPELNDLYKEEDVK